MAEKIQVLQLPPPALQPGKMHFSIATLVHFCLSVMWPLFLYTRVSHGLAAIETGPENGALDGRPQAGKKANDAEVADVGRSLLG